MRGAASSAWLEELADLTPQFGAWVEAHRSALAPAAGVAGATRGYVERLALRPPAVLLIRPFPTAGARPVAARLAERLGLPLRSDAEGDARAVRHLAPERFTEGGWRDVAQRIVADRGSLWVVERPPFGEDPPYALLLRAEYPPERLRWLEVPQLDWDEARAGVLAGLPFACAARLHLAAGGDPGYLEELVRLDGDRAGTPLPQTVRARYRLQMQSLSGAARDALERLSLHPGPLPAALLQGFGSEVDELVREGWLEYEGGWRFRREAIRRAVAASLEPGRALRFHQWLAERGCEHGLEAVAWRHERLLEARFGFGTVRPAGPRPQLARAAVASGEELALAVEPLGRRASLVDGELQLARTPYETDANGFLVELPGEPCVLELAGELVLPDGGAGERTPPLELVVDGETIPLRAERGSLDEGAGALPGIDLADAFSVRLFLDGSETLRLRSRASEAVVRLELRAFTAEASLEARPAFVRARDRAAAQRFVVGPRGAEGASDDEEWIEVA